MLRYRWVAAALLVSGLAVGCDDGGKSATPVGGAAAQPAATQPASTQPTTQESASHLMIDGRLVQFPPARLRVTKVGDQVTARLYTNDPKAALADDYTGNGYDIVMKLDDIADPAEIYNAFWQYKVASRDFSDSPYGIFLEGIKFQLQPADTTARFLGDALLVRVQLKGQFLQFDQSNVSAAPKQVYVEGFLLANVESKD